MLIGPAKGAEEASIGMTDGGTGVHHEKGASAIGAFGFAWLQAELPQGGGLLVAK